MVRRSLADNAMLLKNFPQGYALDDTHHAHVSILQRFVNDADLDNVYGSIGVSGIVVEVTDDLLRLQQKLMDAVAPFSTAAGTSDAFFKLPSEPSMHEVPALIEYVGAFVPEHSGKNLMPHVTIGVGLKNYLDEMIAAPFEAFTFSPASASVYQLGDFGTARKQLKTLAFHD